MVSVRFGILCALLRNGATCPIAKLPCLQNDATCSLGATIVDEIKSQLRQSLRTVPKTILEHGRQAVDLIAAVQRFSGWLGSHDFHTRAGQDYVRNGLLSPIWACVAELFVALTRTLLQEEPSMAARYPIWLSSAYRQLSSAWRSHQLLSASGARSRFRSGTSSREGARRLGLLVNWTNAASASPVSRIC